MGEEVDYKNIVEEIIEILDGPGSPTEVFASAGNIIALIHEVLDKYNKLEETVKHVATEIGIYR